MKTIRLLAGWVGVLVVLSLLSTAGCTDEVNPVLGTERAYTVYGFFDARADTQAMRIFAIEGRLEMTRPKPLDAQVASLDLTDGTQAVWQDSVVQYESGGFGHVYWAPFRAAFEHRYRLAVTRPDGAVTKVEVDVPPFSEPALLPPTVASRFVFIPVLWQRAPRINNIRVVYDTNCGDFELPYPLDQEMVDVGTIVTIRLSEDTRAIFQRALVAGCTFRDLRLNEIVLKVLISNAGWVPPTGVYDDELLVEPGTFSNVENGFGFVGSGYTASFRWDPPDSILTAAGFMVDVDEDDGGE